MEISASLVKELRTRTGAGMMDCKVALQETGGDIEKAIEFLRVKGLARAQKRSGRETAEGVVVSYIHPGSRIGVLVEVNCETDFVARTEEFNDFARNMAMQVAATAPLALSREEISQEVVDKERDVLKSQAAGENKPEKVVEKIVEGRLEKFFSENCLLDQAYIKDDSKKVKDLVNELIAKLGENIRVARYARFELGR